MQVKEFIPQNLEFPLFKEEFIIAECCKKSKCCKSYKKKGKHCKKCPKI